MIRRTTTLSLVLLLTIAPALAGDRWLHVRVEEQGRKGATVNVNVPLGVVETMLPLIEVDELQHGVLQLDELEELDLGATDLREIVRALRDTPDTKFVTIESDDEIVHVAKEDNYLIVRAEDRGRRSESVRVRMPLDVVEALVGGDPGRLDLLAALRALGEHEGEDLVSVVSDDSTVRVWIDSNGTGE